MGLRTKKLRLATYQVTLGQFNIALLIHSCPAPNHCIDAALLDAETKDQLRQHQAFALLTLVGGEDYIPMERLIFLTRPRSPFSIRGGSAWDARKVFWLFHALFSRRWSNSGVEEKGALWASWREKGQPKELFVRALVTAVKGEPWAMTAGHAMLDLPDFGLPGQQRGSN